MPGIDPTGRRRALLAPGRAARIASALWIIWAVLVWNVVFDHVLEVAGREYVHTAAVAAGSGESYLLVDEWMRPAVRRGLWTASIAAGAIVVTGLFGIRLASGVRRAKDGNAWPHIP